MRIGPLYVAFREEHPRPKGTAYHALPVVLFSEEMAVEAVNEVLPVDGAEGGVVQHAALEAVVN